MTNEIRTFLLYDWRDDPIMVEAKDEDEAIYRAEIRRGICTIEETDLTPDRIAHFLRYDVQFEKDEEWRR